MGNLFLKSECDAKQKKNSLRDILKTDNVTNWLITNINGLIFMWPEYWLYASLIFRILFVKIFFPQSPYLPHNFWSKFFSRYYVSKIVANASMSNIFWDIKK